MPRYMKKTITIKDYQAKWIEKNHINFSRWVQAKLDEEIEKEGKLNVKED